MLLIKEFNGKTQFLGTTSTFELILVTFSGGIQIRIFNHSHVVTTQDQRVSRISYKTKKHLKSGRKQLKFSPANLFGSQTQQPFRNKQKQIHHERKKKQREKKWQTVNRNNLVFCVGRK